MEQKKNLIEINPGIPKEQHWKFIDPVFTEARRRLYQDPIWRYGPGRVHEVAGGIYETIRKYTSIQGKRCLDLGCGVHHPLGTSAIMLLNGAGQAVAMDPGRPDPRRSAEALFDLLIDCLIHPDRWHWSGMAKGEFQARIFQFGLGSLFEGDIQAGIRNVPLMFFQGNADDIPGKLDRVDIIYSRSVLEHIFDLQTAMDSIFRIMPPGGVAFHSIDLQDHRMYTDPIHYHPWSFLAEDESWSDGLCNRLRASEILDIVQKSGFQILDQTQKEKALPSDFRPKLKGRFCDMDDEELRITSMGLVLGRP